MTDTRRDDACGDHQDPDCGQCARYKLSVALFNGRSDTMTFWVGQNAGIEWGPMGMEDAVHLTFVPPSPAPTPAPETDLGRIVE